MRNCYKPMGSIWVTRCLMTLTLLIGFQSWMASESVAQEAPGSGSIESVVHEPSPTVTTPLIEPAYLDQVVDPSEYRVGPGDRLTIHVWGEQPQRFTVTITPEASLIIPALGELSVRGLTLAEVKSRVERRLAGLYPDTPRSITLTEVRRFRVTVAGAVNTPGLFVVTANTRASEVLKRAGLSTLARRRGIRLERDGATLTVDLDRFERLGDRRSNTYLAEGDILHVPARSGDWNTVDISGAVRAAGSFDFLSGDKVGDLIDLAYGLGANADTTRIELWRFGELVDSAYHLPWPQGTTYTAWRDLALHSDDRLVVRSRREFRAKHSVYVSGEVLRPGRYVFVSDSIPLRDIIDSTGGFTDRADLRNAVITRGARHTRPDEKEQRVRQIPTELRTRAESDWILAEALSLPGRVVTDFVGLFERGDNAFNVSLIEGDEVLVPRYTSSVSIIGRVVQPGLVSHDAGAPLAYYLERAGGYAWRADRKGTFVVKGATGATIKRSKIREITAGDTIVIPTKRDRNVWGTIRETLVVLSSVATVYLVVDQATQ